MHRRFEASQRVLEQFFEYAETLGLENQLRLEDSPMPSRTTLPPSSPRRSPSCCSAGSPPSPLEELPSSPSSLCGKAWSSPTAASPAQQQGQGAVDGGDAPVLLDGAGEAHEEAAPQEPQQEAAADDPPGDLPQQALRVSALTRPCPHCQKRLKEHNFTRHLRIHENDAPQKSCNLCGLKLTRSDHMKRHLQHCPRYV